MPVTISGDGGIAGISSLGGGDFVAGSLTSSGDLIAGPQAVDRATLFVDDSDNSVSINTTVTPAAGVFLQVADATDPIVSLNNTANGEVRLGCTAAGGYIGTESNHPFNIETNSTIKAVVLANGDIGVGNTSPTELIELRGNLDQSNVFLTTNSTAANSGSTIAFQSTTNGWDLNSAHASIKGGRVNGSNGYLDFSTRQSGSTDVVMRLDENGRVGIQELSPDYELHITATDPVIMIESEGAYEDIASILFRALDSGNTARNMVRIDGTGTGSNSGALIFNTRNNGTLGEAARFNSTGNLAFPNGQGIDFSAAEGAGATSTILDDYEEGTWTPVYTASTGGQLDTVLNQGIYTKIGSSVYISFRIGTTQASFAGFSGQVRVDGLPFTVGSSVQARVGGLSINELYRWQTNFSNFRAYPEANNTTINLNVMDSTSANYVNCDVSDMSTSTNQNILAAAGWYSIETF